MGYVFSIFNGIGIFFVSKSGFYNHSTIPACEDFFFLQLLLLLIQVTTPCKYKVSYKYF